MNIWSLAKHDNIKLLLISVQMQLGLENFCINDDKEKNYFSIVLIKPDQPEVRSYIYTYDKTDALYGIHLEYPHFSENGFNDTLMIYDELSLRQVIDTLATHFEITDFKMAL